MAELGVDDRGIIVKDRPHLRADYNNFVDVYGPEEDEDEDDDDMCVDNVEEKDYIWPPTSDDEDDNKSMEDDGSTALVQSLLVKMRTMFKAPEILSDEEKEERRLKQKEDKYQKMSRREKFASDTIELMGRCPIAATLYLYGTHNNETTPRLYLPPFNKPATFRSILRAIYGNGADFSKSPPKRQKLAGFGWGDSDTGSSIFSDTSSISGMSTDTGSISGMSTDTGTVSRISTDTGSICGSDSESPRSPIWSQVISQDGGLFLSQILGQLPTTPFPLCECSMEHLLLCSRFSAESLGQYNERHEGGQFELVAPLNHTLHEEPYQTYNFHGNFLARRKNCEGSSFDILRLFYYEYSMGPYPDPVLECIIMSPVSPLSTDIEATGDAEVLHPQNFPCRGCNRTTFVGVPLSDDESDN